MSDLTIFVGGYLLVIVFMLGLLAGGWLRDRAWREKANGPTRMLSGGRFYQVLTSEAYEDLRRNYR